METMKQELKKMEALYRERMKNRDLIIQRRLEELLRVYED